MKKTYKVEFKVKIDVEKFKQMLEENLMPQAKRPSFREYVNEFLWDGWASNEEFVEHLSNCKVNLIGGIDEK